MSEGFFRRLPPRNLGDASPEARRGLETFIQSPRVLDRILLGFSAFISFIGWREDSLQGGITALLVCLGCLSPFFLLSWWLKRRNRRLVTHGVRAAASVVAREEVTVRPSRGHSYEALQLTICYRDSRGEDLEGAITFARDQVPPSIAALEDGAEVTLLLSGRRRFTWAVVGEGQLVRVPRPRVAR